MKAFNSRLPISMALSFVTAFSVSCMEDQAKNPADAAKSGETALLQDFVIENIAQNVIVASYRDLRDQTSALRDLSLKLKKNPSKENLEIAQKKWREARVPWESTEGFLFGPVDSLGVDPAIDSWPLSKIDLDKILETRTGIDANFVRQLGTDVQGFHTAEYLLFGDGITTNVKTIEQMTPAQLTYLAAVTEVLAEQTEKLFNSWTVHHDPTDTSSKAYVEVIIKPGLDNRFYPSRSAVLQEFVQGMIKIAVEVGKGKISDPLGGSLQTADGSIVESQFSWNSLIDFQNNIHSMMNLYTGDYNGNTGAGLDELVRRLNPDLNVKILTQIKTSETSIADIGGPENMSFTLAIKDPAARARALTAIENLAKLERTLQTELLPLFE